MATFTYPQNDFDDPDVLISVLGSFWATTYQGNPLLQDLTGSAGQIAQQTYFQFLELVQSVSRHDIPLFHKDNWYALSFTETELEENSAIPAKYLRDNALFERMGPQGLFLENLTYSPSTNTAYGDKENQPYFYVKKPTDLVDASVIHSGIVNPAVTLTDGIDFWLEDDNVVFRSNPFDNPLIAKRDVLDSDGSIKDKECTVWVYRGSWDWQLVYEQFGYVLRLSMPSSQNYKDFVNAVMDALVEGTSLRSQQTALSVSFGVPVVKEAEETVKVITKDSKYLNVITDSHVYQFPKTNNTLVAVGDVVKAGQSLTDALQFFELNRGETVPASQVPAITVDEGLLAWGFMSGITFNNENVNITVTEDVDGYTKLSWELGGFSLDVSKFWDDVHKKGIEEGKTLAMLLDERTSPVGQPTAASLPETINPLQFLVDNFLRNNAFIVKLKAGGGNAKLPFLPASQIKKIQPPHSVMILIVELVYADSPVIMESAGTATKPGYEEDLSSYPAMAIVEPGTLSSVLSENVKCKSIGGRCI